MRSNFEKLKIEIYGESHAPEIGVRLGGVLDGCELSLRCVDNLLERRKAAASCGLLRERRRTLRR